MRRINMKQTAKSFFLALMLKLAVFATFTGCSNSFSGMSDDRPDGFGGGQPGDNQGGFGQVVEIVDDGSTTDYVDATTAEPSCVIAEDLYENFVATGTVYITFDGTTWSAEYSDGLSAADFSISNTENSEEDEQAKGVEIKYNGTGKIKYVLSGTYTGTVFIKNKKADAAVVLNGVNISSDSGTGPVLRFSSEKRTFIVVADGTENTLTDTRLLNQSGTMYDDKKGSVYSKGVLIFTGETTEGTSDSAGGGGWHTQYN